MKASAMLGCALLAGLVVTPAHAQTWPSKPIRVISEIAAGGTSDTILRQASQSMMERIGQPLVVNNRPGAGGIVAMEACAKSPPDGYTLCMLAPSGTVWNAYVFNKLPYDAGRDLRPIARMYFQIQAVFARGDLPARTIEELHALAASKPGSLNMGTLGFASQADMFRQWLSERWKTNIVGVPYNGGAALTTALLAGQIDFVFMGLGSLGSAVNLLQSGKVKALALSGGQRNKRFPDVPTMNEAGFEGATGGIFWGMGAPSGVPDAIVRRMSAEILQLYKEPKFIELHESLFLDPAPATTEEFEAYLKAQREFAGVQTRKFNIPKQ